MLILSILLAQVLVAPLATAQPPVPSDTTRLRAEAPAAPVQAPAEPASMTMDLDGRTAASPASSIEFEVSSTPAADAREREVAVTRVRIVRAPDSLSAELARRVGSGDAIPSMDLRLPGRNGAPALRLRLRGVNVVSARLLMSGDTLGLTQQRLSLEESITQLTADLAEARRQYGVAESLEKQRLSASLDLARARGVVEALTRRLATQQERQALVVRQLASWMPVQEELVLSASRAEVEALQR
ncbi:MAG TPA: hypothetical protein VFT96_04365 [Gemmatimonadaceae bacterium]|nr:hypothetical protein [Gemmatimonadaceae bacterium]